jgi:hypothetical protein
VRVAVVLALLTACSFRTNGGSSPADASTTRDVPAPTSDGANDAPTDAAPAIDAARMCPAGYDPVAGAPATSKYKLFSYGSGPADHTNTWTTAKQTCESDGTHLIVVETAAEATSIGAQLQYAPASPYFWEGITDEGHEAMWKTVLGADATFLPWAVGQPNGGTSANCALFDPQGNLYDFSCSGYQPFACECE